jgi:hypothetical protein
MQPADYDERRVGVALRVRQNVTPAAIGAAFLLYFGFFQLTEPTDTELFDRASWVFYHTLRLGGVAMGAVAAWSLLGQSITLAVDAVVTVAIGALLILTGLGMAVDGGAMVQTVINVVCGGMFSSSGVRNWRDYRSFIATKTSNHPAIPTRDLDDFDRPPHPSPDVRRKPPSPLPGEGRGEGRAPRESTTPIAPPPEGFLASLAKKPPPPANDEGPST